MRGVQGFTDYDRAMLAAPPAVVVHPAPGFEQAATETARDLGLPLAATPGAGPPSAGALTLTLDEDGWGLTDGARGASAVRADFVRGGIGQRVRDVLGGDRHGESRLARALGLRRHPAPRVLDATVGLGRESVLAAALGCHVIACERSPVVALLLRDGLERAARAGLEDVVSRVEVRTADARDVLPSLDPPPDVVIVDPMFPERGKAAKARREMQLLQRLLGADDDAGGLLDIALAHARRRVVVKRPVHAPPVDGRRPDHAVPGRAARYDIYLTRSDS